MTCRPSFKYSPVIDEVVLAGSTLTVTFDMEFSTMGLQNCGEMFAQIDVYDSDDVLRGQRNMTTTEVNQYVNTQMPSVSVTGLEELESCYTVHITYGQVNKTSSQVTANSDSTCYDGICTLTNASITLIDHALSADGNSRDWIFDADVTAGKWCSIVNPVVCVTDTVNSLKYCNQPDESMTTLSDFTVAQTGSYNATNWTYEVTYTSDDGSNAAAKGNLTEVNPPPVSIEDPNSLCQFSYESHLDVTSDKLNKVYIKQTTNVTYNNFCGALTNQFNTDGTALYQPTASAASDYLWTMESTTGTYCYTTTMTFSNYPDFPITTDNVCTDWRQACYLSITAADFNSFIAADNSTSTEAAANMTVAGEILGDCGTNTTVSISMSGSDGSSYTYDVTDDFYTTAGQNIIQNISRGVDTYSLFVSMDAGSDAESVDHHQNRTSGDGYNNYLSDMLYTNAVSKAPECYLSQESIEWVSYAEIDEWRNNIIATYKGMVRAEASCTNLAATLKIKNSTSESNFNKTDVTLVPTGDGMTYTWTGSLEAPNDKESYVGKLTFQVANDSSENVQLMTDAVQWTPPCYLEVLDFSKIDQTDSLDQLRTIL